MEEIELRTEERNAVDEKINCWVEWCRTRRILAAPVKGNILARLRPSRRTATAEPDSFLDADMPFLNAAIHALCEEFSLSDEAQCFLGVYWFRTNIKVLANLQNCARGTVYNRARRFGKRAQALSVVIRDAHEKFSYGGCSKFVDQQAHCVD